MRLGDIEYKVHDGDVYLFSIYGRKFSKQAVIDELNKRGYYTDQYYIKWETETTYNARSGRMHSTRTNWRIVDIGTKAVESSGRSVKAQPVVDAKGYVKEV